MIKLQPWLEFLWTTFVLVFTECGIVRDSIITIGLSLCYNNKFFHTLSLFHSLYLCISLSYSISFSLTLSLFLLLYLFFSYSISFSLTLSLFLSLYLFFSYSTSFSLILSLFLIFLFFPISRTNNYYAICIICFNNAGWVFVQCPSMFMKKERFTYTILYSLCNVKKINH